MSATALMTLIDSRLIYLCLRHYKGENDHATVAQLVEHQLPKLRAAGSSPVCRSLKIRQLAPADCLIFYSPEAHNSPFW